MRNSVLRPGILLAVLTATIVCVYFRQVLFDGRVFYAGDIARIYLPQQIALSRALASGSLPWWTANIGAGYPLLAEGEIGALYPLNWLLHNLLAPELALSVSIILHYLLGGTGFFLYARSLGTSRKAAYFGSLVLTLGGFYVAHLSHLSIVTTAAWLPWMFVLTHRLLGQDIRGRSLLWATLSLGVVMGLQFLTSHAQISLLGLIALTAYALFVAWPSGLSGAALRRWGCWIGALLLGMFLAAPQLLATLELTSLSQRAGGLDSAFFTSYSLHPALLVTFVSPFLLGNPYPHGSVELMGYVGLLPLALAINAIGHPRSRATRFFLGLALAGTCLALGRWNPLYSYLRLIPFVNLFRVPARYLYWTSFALAILSTLGLEELCALRARTTTRAGWGLLSLSGLALSAVLVSVWSASQVEQLVNHWHWLPAALAVAALGVVAAKRHTKCQLWLMAAYGVLLVDLYAYGNVLFGTFSSTMPQDEVTRKPRSLSFFAHDRELYRLYIKEEILPALSVMRESFYPNLALASGLSSANIYQPLVPREYGSYLDNLNAQRLDRLNVKYYLIPQLLPVDEERELYDVQNPFASLPANTWLSFPPTDLSELEIESYLSHSVGYENGHLVAELLLRDTSGREVRFPLRAGVETAEWAYERDDVRTQVQHQMPVVATTFPARSGFPPQEHLGHTYLARVRLDPSLRVVAAMWHPLIPEAFVRLERVRLIGPSEEKLLTHLVGLGDHSIVYRSEDVLIYRNEDALPRAYTLPNAAVKLLEDEVILPETFSRHDIGPVEVLHYEDAYVSLRAKLETPGYLILADLAYPGWRATVDGIEVPILRADGIFRALALSPGEHYIVFQYKPAPFRCLLSPSPDLRAQTVWDIIAARYISGIARIWAI